MKKVFCLLFLLVSQAHPISLGKSIMTAQKAIIGGACGLISITIGGVATVSIFRYPSLCRQTNFNKKQDLQYTLLSAGISIISGIPAWKLLSSVKQDLSSTKNSDR